MTITQELVEYEVLLEIMAMQEQHDYDVMLEIRNRSFRDRDMPGTAVAEHWLERHGMDVDDRQTCSNCLTWSEGHAHSAVAN
jgi:hypothetical protein